MKKYLIAFGESFLIYLVISSFFTFLGVYIHIIIFMLSFSALIYLKTQLTKKYLFGLLVLFTGYFLYELTISLLNIVNIATKTYNEDMGTSLSNVGYMKLAFDTGVIFEFPTLFVFSGLIILFLISLIWFIYKFIKSFSK